MTSRGKSASQKIFQKSIKDKSAKKPSGSSPATGVYESAPHAPVGENRQIELMLSNIIARLERIEEKIDENVYPPESAIRPEFVRQVKKAQADIRKGKGKVYASVDDFFKEIEA